VRITFVSQKNTLLGDALGDALVDPIGPAEEL
jgi:hypothetical protein